MSNGNKNSFCYFYYNLLSHFHLSPIEGLFLTLVEGLSHDRQKRCYASRRRLAEYLNVSETAIYDLMDRLARRNLLIRGEKTRLGTMSLTVSDEVAEFIQQEKWQVAERNKEELGMSV